MDTNCGACGIKLIEGKHPNTRCEPKEWAINHGNLLGQIFTALAAILALFESSGPKAAPKPIPAPVANPTPAPAPIPAPVPEPAPVQEWPRKKKK